LVIGIFCIAIGSLPVSNTYGGIRPDGQGGYLPYGVTVTETPFFIMIIPGLILLAAGIVLVASSGRKLKRLKTI